MWKNPYYFGRHTVIDAIRFIAVFLILGGAMVAGLTIVAMSGGIGGEKCKGDRG